MQAKIAQSRRCGEMSSWRTMIVLWGIPGMAMLAAMWLEGHAPRSHLDRHVGLHGSGLHHERPTVRAGVALGGFVGLWWGSKRAWGMLSRSRDIGASRIC